MSKINETKFLVRHESYKCQCRLNEMYIIQNKNGTMMNVTVNVKSRVIGVLVKKDTCGILVRAIASVIERVALVSI